MSTFTRRPEAPIKSRNDYRLYRQEVREDFQGFCAHCGVHESDWDHGPKNYQLDHFRPKTRRRPEFKPLEHDFYNLYWCCHICNRRDGKGDQWPSPEEEARGQVFVDLCKDDWQTHYEILDDGSLNGLTTQARYTIEAIGLNDKDYVAQRLNILGAGGVLFQRLL